MKRVVFFVVGLAFAASVLADLSKYKDWDRSPEAYFLTPAERTEWKAVTTDEAAEKFIALYWARRGGEPFKQEISRRIAAADQQFKLARYKRGADSVRGRLLVTLGPPSRVGQTRAQEGGALDGSEGATIPRTDTGFSGDASSAAVLYTWTWDKDKLPPVLGLSELRAQISVDPRVGTDELRNGAQVEKAIATLAEKTIVNPNATLVAAAPARPGSCRTGAGAAGTCCRRRSGLRAAPAAPRCSRFRPRSRRRSSRLRPRWRGKPASGPGPSAP